MPWFKKGKREALARLDLTPIRRIVVARYPWGGAKACSIEYRYKKFLEGLIDDSLKLKVPDDEVDLFWQAHLEDAKKYEADCKSVFGRTVKRPPRDTPVPRHSTAEVRLIPPPSQVARYAAASRVKSVIIPVTDDPPLTVRFAPLSVLLAEGSDPGLSHEIPLIIVADDDDPEWADAVVFADECLPPAGNTGRS